MTLKRWSICWASNRAVCSLRISWQLLQGEASRLSSGYIEVLRRYPSLLRRCPEQICLDQHFFVEQLVLKKHIPSKCISNSLLLGNRVELEALAGRFEWLGCPKFKRRPRAHNNPVREQSTCIGLGGLQALLRSLVFGSHCELFGRYVLRLMFVSELMRLDFQIKRLLSISNA